jgi:hypothetical protein
MADDQSLSRGRDVEQVLRWFAIVLKENAEAQERVVRLFNHMWEQGSQSVLASLLMSAQGRLFLSRVLLAAIGSGSEHYCRAAGRLCSWEGWEACVGGQSAQAVAELMGLAAKERSFIRAVQGWFAGTRSSQFIPTIWADNAHPGHIPWIVSSVLPSPRSIASLPSQAKASLLSSPHTLITPLLTHLASLPPHAFGVFLEQSPNVLPNLLDLFTCCCQGQVDYVSSARLVLRALKAKFSLQKSDQANFLKPKNYLAEVRQEEWMFEATEHSPLVSAVSSELLEPFQRLLKDPAVHQILRKHDCLPVAELISELFFLSTSATEALERDLLSQLSYSGNLVQTLFAVLKPAVTPT